MEIHDIYQVILLTFNKQSSSWVTIGTVHHGWKKQLVILKKTFIVHVKIDEDSFPQFWTHCRGPELLNARGIEYSPILEINPDSAFILHTIPTSSRNPIFGFQTIVGTKSTHLITLSKFHYFSLA